jgi:alpha/beta superfamily hydrolase
VILVSPPVQRSGFSVMRESPVWKLVIQGTYDAVCPAEALAPEFAAWREPKRLILVPEASHFYDKRLAGLAEALRQGLSEATSPRS